MQFRLGAIQYHTHWRIYQINKDEIPNLHYKLIQKLPRPQHGIIFYHLPGPFIIPLWNAQVLVGIVELFVVVSVLICGHHLQYENV